MKSYLSLIPAYAKVHKKQNRMTILCIILAVFLVTAIFGMADMEIRAQKVNAISQYGNWHIQIKDLSPEDAAVIAARPDVAFSSWYNVINYRLKEDYFIQGKRAAVCGMEPSMLDIMEYDLLDGCFPENDRQIVLTSNARETLGLSLGDTVTLQTPSGESAEFSISAFGMDNQSALKTDAVIAFLPLRAFQNLYQNINSGSGDVDLVYYVQFSRHCNIRKAITDIREQFSLSREQIGENTLLLGLLGFSKDSYMLGLYATALVLFFLVLTAGVLMVASSMNSSIAQRTQFFGLLRCIGAGRKQIRRFVLLESLNWCCTAIPAGILLGSAAVWVLCAALRFLSPRYFADMPVLGISPAGILCGAVTGLCTVLLAARSPAKRAARVSPVTAVSGNAVSISGSQKAADTSLGRVETALGIRHATLRKKNFLLMSCSFALSIILFLTFSVSTDFMRHAIKPLQPYTPDLSIASPDQSPSVDSSLPGKIAGISGVKRVYARKFAYDVPAVIRGESRTVMLISYDLQQLNWVEESQYLTDGDLSLLTEDANYVLNVHYNQEGTLETGESIETSLGELTVAGILSHCPFDPLPGAETLICSEETFTRLTGEENYTIVDIQLTRQATEEDIRRIRELAGDPILFSDQRLSNQETRGAFWAYALFLYGFLAVIVLITCFHIVNSISMSAAARMKQYGAMRAVGMSCRQFTKMIAAEALTYALSGCLLGCAFGLPLHWLLYEKMVTVRWGTPWHFPLSAVTLILLAVLLAALAAVRGPALRIRRMSVTETIHAE
ncbi:MAG: ABC transporter permease [Lachnospiraceae bacterium]|nr:ABC transporter permease [Lachnospiraceae bacterium]